MTAIEITDTGEIVVDASVIADALGLDPGQVQPCMREGRITSLCESGLGNDAGRIRLTFFHGSRRLRLVVDAQNQVLRRSVVDFGDWELPASARRPGA